MSGVRIDTGDADRELRRIATLLNDLRPFWPRVRRLFIGWMRLQFQSEGAFWGEGTRWVGLNPVYAQRKRMLWGERPILQASGQAYRAALAPNQTLASARMLTLEIDDTGRNHGPVLQYHQAGDGVPRRIVIGETLPPLAASQLAEEADAYVRDFLGRF